MNSQGFDKRKEKNMFITRETIEKLLKDHDLCTQDQFRNRCDNKRWRVGSYKACIKKVLAHYGLSDDHGNGTRHIVDFLNGGDLNHDIRAKRKHADCSMVESSEDEEGFGPTRMDVSMTSVLSREEDSEVLELKRLLCEKTKELEGRFSLLLGEKTT